MTKITPQVEKSHKPNPKYNLEVLKRFPELYGWLKQISRYCKVQDFIYISDYKDGKIRIKIFTKDHQYNVSAKLPEVKRPSADYKLKVGDKLEKLNDGYLGCIANTRKPRAGEDWNRGNDLADGSYSEKTWQEIKDDIIAYELVKVVRNSPDKEPEGRAIEVVVEKDEQLIEMLKGNLSNLKQNDELGFVRDKKHFVIRKGEFSK